ncbi:hypothetical protein [Actinomadura roseirufa]|uniref:hypothetical protein n=1 Tax=Actinomadura roseirufa TaxID=2094049 RepID=UPI001041441C|nr:hypothetical protein [Actinomadura roseirufa]
MRFGMGAYKALFGVPGMRRLFAGYFLARLPSGMVVLSLLLLGQSTVGVGRAGLLAGAFVAPLVITAPLLGRAVDRFGPARALGGAALAHCLALIGLAACATGGLPLPVSTLAAIVTGATAPPTAATLRTALPQVLEESLLPTGLAFESILVEGVYLAGPLLVAALSGATAWLPLLIAGLSTLAGVSLMLTGPALRHATASGAPALWSWGPLSAAAVRRLLPIAVLLIPSMALLDVAIATYTAGRHQPHLLGLIAAGVAAASLTGGLIFGARPWPGTPSGRLVTLAAWFAATTATASLTSSPWLFIPLAIAAGAAIAPSLTLLSALAVTASPREHRAETFTWLSTMNFAGQLALIPAASALGQRFGSSGPLLLMTALATATALYTPATRRSPSTPVTRRPSPEADM